MLESTIHWREGLGWHGLHCLLGPVHRDAIPILARSRCSRSRSTARSSTCSHGRAGSSRSSRRALPTLPRPACARRSPPPAARLARACRTRARGPPTSPSSLCHSLLRGVDERESPISQAGGACRSHSRRAPRSRWSPPARPRRTRGSARPCRSRTRSSSTASPSRPRRRTPHDDEDRADRARRASRSTRSSRAPAGTACSSRPGRATDAVIQKVTWTGGKVPTGEDSLFQFLGQPAKAGTYTFQVQQTYSDGSIVDWSDPESGAEPGADDRGQELARRRRYAAADDRRARRRSGRRRSSAVVALVSGGGGGRGSSHEHAGAGRPGLGRGRWWRSRVPAAASAHAYLTKTFPSPSATWTPRPRMSRSPSTRRSSPASRSSRSPTRTPTR